VGGSIGNVVLYVKDIFKTGKRQNINMMKQASSFISRVCRIAEQSQIMLKRRKYLTNIALGNNITKLFDRLSATGTSFICRIKKSLYWRFWENA